MISAKLSNNSLFSYSEKDFSMMHIEINRHLYLVSIYNILFIRRKVSQGIVGLYLIIQFRLVLATEKQS